MDRLTMASVNLKTSVSLQESKSQTYVSFPPNRTSSASLAPEEFKEIIYLHSILIHEKKESHYKFALSQILLLIKEPSAKRNSVLTLLLNNQILKTMENVQVVCFSNETIQKICLQILLIILKEKNEQIQYFSIYRVVVNVMNEHITDEAIQINGMNLLKTLSQLEENDGRQLFTEVQQREMIDIALLSLATIRLSVKTKVAALQMLHTLFQTNSSLLDVLADIVHLLPVFCNQDGWHQELMEAALPIYFLISKVEKYRKALLVNDLHRILQVYAVDHITSENKLELILNIFVNMNHQGVILFLVDCNFIDTALFTAMSTFQENVSISIAGFKLLKMAAPFYCQTSSLKKWAAILYYSGFSHFTSAEIQIAMHEAASEILKNNPKFITQFGEDIEDHQYPLQSFCLGSFFQHKGNTEVFIAVCKTIYWLASGSVNLSDLIMQKNTFIEILETMRRYKRNAEVVLFGCRAVKGLCIFSPPERRLSVCKYKYLFDIFWKIFSIYQQNPAIIMEAICLFACLMDAEFLEIPNFVWKAVSDAIVNHSDYVLIQESALEVLAVTIPKERTSKYQVDCENLNQILDIMKKFPENLCIQKKGLYLLQLLTHMIPESFKIDQMAKMIVDLMKKHPFVPSIQVECCILIVLFEEHRYHSKTESFIRYDCQTPVFAIFRNYSDFPEILDIAYQCFFVIIQENKKSIMLLRACAARSFTEVECLVHLNADVNYKEEGYTPLLYACENGDEKIVRCLLTKEVFDLLTPLKVACEKHYNKIVGLLLQQIGQEPQTRSIYWNNLGLGSLNQHWLFPTFVSSASSPNVLAGIGKKLAHQIQVFFRKYFDPNESFISYSSNTSSNTDFDSADVKILAEIELKEWQQTTLTGSVIPFHIHDPRMHGRNWQTMDVHCRGQTSLASLKDMEKLWLRKKCSLTDDSSPGTETLNFEDWAIIDVEYLEKTQESLECSQGLLHSTITQSLNSSVNYSKDDSTPLYSSVRRSRNFDSKSSPSMTNQRTNSCSYPVSHKWTGSSENQSNDKIQNVDISHNNCASLIGFITLQYNYPQSFACLQELNISHNKLTFLPDDSFDFLPALQKLDLSSNQFQVFPRAILSCPRLKILKLKNNLLQDTKESNLPISFSLKKLDLSGNYFKVFPKWISNFMPGLEKLYLKSTEMERIMDEPLQLKRLIKMDLSNNSISVLPDKFFVGSNNLMILKAIDNKLVQLPSEETIPELPQLQELHLSHNKFIDKEPFFLPKFILKLPSLTVLDMRNNKLTGICPPAMWNAKDLKKLMLANNQISYLNLSEGAEKWRNLEVLDISYNKLNKIPLEIGYLTSLRCLDFSYNPEIRHLPDELGHCEKIWEMPLNGLEISLDIRLLKGRISDLILYLNHKLKKAQSYYQMKMMVVGYGGHGKTTLLRSLMQEKEASVTTATVGIHVKDWKFLHKQKRHSAEYTISTWDFAGQEDFYSTHQCFLSNQAIYLVVYDIRCENIELLKCWLANIHAQAPNCPVLVVGTHKDLISDENTFMKIKDEIQALQKKTGFPVINDVIIVDSRSENKGISHLRNVIKQVISNYKVHGHYVMGQKIPATYIKLAKLISSKAAFLKNEYPVLTRQEMLVLLKSNQLNMTTAEFNQAIRFLDETGILRHFDEAANQLKDLYFIDPGWLCRMLAQVVTVEQINPYINKSGVMQKKYLRLLFTEKCADTEQTYIFPPSKIPQFLKLLEKFEIALSQNEKELLIPCRLPISHPDLLIPNGNSIQRIYRMFFIPIGLWSRLITRIIVFSKKNSILPLSNPKSLECYRYSIFAYWSESKYFYLKQEHKKRDEIIIQVPNTKQGCRLIGEVVDHLDALIEEWYPGLLIADPYGVCPLEKLTPCPDCKEKQRHFFNLDDLIHASDSNDKINCPVHKQPVLLASMAPDVMLSDFAEEFFLQQNQFYLQQSCRNLLGHGQFGKVYQATYQNQSVAVKLFANIGDYHPHKMLRKEVTVMIRLKHPNVISLLAVGLRPRLMVMEKAPYGSLDHVLDNRQNMNPLLIHRIALQIAEGLMYLHQQMIIYRDLKPANILVFSLSLSSLINVKISDYGISQLIAPYGLTAKEGTPGYQAPEVARRENYSFQADLFSYGIMLYMLLSGGKHPFEHLKNPCERDKAISDELNISLSFCKSSCTWPDMFDLLHQCLDHSPDQRPTAEQVCMHLKNPETISLKQIILVTKFYTIDCMTVTEDTNCNLTLWVTSGNDQNIQISWLKPNDNVVDVRGKILDISCPLCLFSINDIILLGCISGRIEVFHVDEKQHLHSSSLLPDAVLSIFCFHRFPDSDLILAGSADGNISVFLLESLIHIENCEPLCIQNIQFHEPVMDMCQYGNVIYASCGDSVFKLSLQRNTTKLNRNFISYPCFEVVKMKMSHNLFPVDQEIPNINTISLLGKMMYITRCNDSTVEIWDIVMEKYKNHVDIFSFLTECGANQARITATLLDQNNKVFWVGTGGGHLVLLECHSLQYLRVICRHPNPICSLLMYSSPGPNASTEIPLVLCGTYDSRFQQGRSEENYGCISVWDANIVEHIKNFKEEARRQQELVDVTKNT